MTRITKSLVFAALACSALSGCGPHLRKLGVCSGGKYRYANPQGVSLPSLDVPNVDEVNGTAPPPPPPAAPSSGEPPVSVWDKGSGQPQPAPAPAPSATPAPSFDPAAPVASPSKPGAMLLPARGSTSFGSC